MQKRKSFLLLLFFIPVLMGNCSYSTNHSQERDTNVVCLNFSANEYEELLLEIRHMDSTFHFSGSLNGNSWILEYPCSLYEKSHSFRFIIPVHADTIDMYFISFKQIINNDTIKAPQYLFDNVDTVIINAGKKIETNTFRDGRLLDDVYFLNDITDKEFLSSVELAANSGFITYILDPDYDEVNNRFAKTVRKYPDSHTLINFLFRLRDQYHTKDDIKKIYDNFSDKQKQSYFGTGIREFLSDSTVLYFQNVLLPAWDTEIPELIIKDFSKINLVISSASWCASCIAEIPLLKKIAGELGDKIEMVYVSMDNTTTVNAWKKLMIDKEITWRSVLCINNLKEIKEQFQHNYSLPGVLMVYPDGRYETIEVRYDEDLRKLYEIAGNQ